MNREACDEVASIFICLELKFRRAVGLHDPENLENARGTTFGQFELFEKLADAAIAIATADSPAAAELVEANGAVRARKAQHHNVFQRDADLDRFADLVRAMIDCVDHGFLNSGQRGKFQTRSAWGRSGYLMMVWVRKLRSM